MINNKCPICNSSQYSYYSYAEANWGIIEQHGFCPRCGYCVEQAYNLPIAGHILDQKRGKKLNGKWYGKDIRKRKRMRRKYHIRHELPRDWFLTMNNVPEKVAKAIITLLYKCENDDSNICSAESER